MRTRAAPACANASACARPIPRPAPVIATQRPTAELARACVGEMVGYVSCQSVVTRDAAREGAGIVVIGVGEEMRLVLVGFYIELLPQLISQW
jgi:hypothetical protein